MANNSLPHRTANDGRRREIREKPDRAEASRRAEAARRVGAKVASLTASMKARQRPWSESTSGRSLGFDPIVARMNEERIPKRTGRAVA